MPCRPIPDVVVVAAVVVVVVVVVSGVARICQGEGGIPWQVGDQAEGQIPTLNCALLENFLLVEKIFVQKCKIWS